MAELVRYVNWAGRLRGGGRARTRPFRDVVNRAERPLDRGPEMAKGQWRRILRAALAGVDLDDPWEEEGRPMARVLRELLQREGRWRVGEEGTNAGEQWQVVTVTSCGAHTGYVEADQEKCTPQKTVRLVEHLERGRRGQGG